MIHAIIFGVAVGDALGYPVQFVSRERLRKNPVVGMGEYVDETGQIELQPEWLIGLWSDDTSLTLCLAKSLINGFNLKDQAEKFLAWQEEGYLSPKGPGFDIGITTARYLSHLRLIFDHGRTEILPFLPYSDDERSNGNGSLMRILPLILLIQGLPHQLQYQLIRQASTLTHPHIRSALCCFYYLKMAEYIIDGEGIAEAYRQVKEDTESLMKDIDCPKSEFKALHRLLNVDLAFLREKEIDSGGYVVSTLEASIWCLLSTDSFAEAVLKAVNLGHDADTTGAITGGLAALQYGFSSIPRDWMCRLKKPELIRSVSKLYRKAGR